MNKDVARVLLFGLGWAWVGFWPTLILTVIGPELLEKD